ncbi:hypothetical protein Vretimale_12523 [Volvox reticuliferus]|uniref:Uncharacterized protein n=1 Tax=Volvox reticuliferus TaxID=1737510 RepID=A0A8J4CDY1_9CHLO|nr:hypothetical protein Vretifemale_9143 [Volvox reticuliferus]GIM08512.1 hypothetical protein Vretimale_12523 [Volvox reticuliferus]
MPGTVVGRSCSNSRRGDSGAGPVTSTAEASVSAHGSDDDESWVSIPVTAVPWVALAEACSQSCSAAPPWCSAALADWGEMRCNWRIIVCTEGGDESMVMAWPS